MRIYDCPTPSDLGRVITPDGVAMILYSVYVLGVLVLGAVQVAYTGAGAPAVSYTHLDVDKRQA